MSTGVQSESLKIYDRNDILLYERILPQKGYAEYVELKDVNPDFQKTVILLEDKSFYQNIGVDFPRTAKCIYTTLFTGQTCGASTITQQYIKLSLGHDNRSLFNKFDEQSISIALNLFLSKDQILERYVNTLYFGNMRYGINSASKGYFDKDNKDLDLAQITFLAAIPNSPSRYDPYKNFAELKSRQNLVLEEMFNEKLIDEVKMNSAKEEKLEIGNYSDSIKSPHLVRMIENDIESGKFVPLDHSVKTTVDSKLYEKVLGITQRHLKEIEKKNVTNASVVVLDAKSGDLLAMVGSADFFSKKIDGEVNTAISISNPGSTIKPFIYGISFSSGFTPATLIRDRKQIITTNDGKSYFPQNYDRSEHGDVSVREALANSYNIPAVVTLKKIGTDRFFSVADRIGMEESYIQNADIGAALGSFSLSLWDLTNAYRVFPNEGKYRGEINYIYKKENISNDRSSEVFGAESRQIAYLITDILDDPESRRSEFGSMSKLELPFPAAVKTGTSSDFIDSWTVGYTKQFVIGVWVGNNNKTQMIGVNGVQGAGEIWAESMLATYDLYKQDFGIKDFEFAQPDGIVTKKICKNTGEIFSDKCSTYAYDEKFIASQTPDSNSVIRYVDVLEPDLIEIVNPLDGENFWAEEGTKIKLKFVPNTDSDSYELLMDGEVVDATNVREEMQFPLKNGRHQLKIAAVKNDQKFESKEVSVFVNLDE